MKKTIFQKLLSVLLISFAATALISTSPVLAGDVDPEELYGTEYAVGLGPGTEDSDLRTILVSVITVLMSFLGIVAVVIILIGGFKWMTAAGNEDKVEEAKNMIMAGVIGLIIIMLAWIIVNWVLSTMVEVIDNNS